MEQNNITINQRIPLVILEKALISALDGEYSIQTIREQLLIDYEGENRIKKAITIINRIIPKNPLMELIIDNKEKVKQALKNRNDRDIILVALLSVAYPFAYDTLIAFGKLFKVQDRVTTQSIKKMLSSKYGGNRALPNGMNAVIPMILEARFFVREKVGIYMHKDHLNYNNEVTGKIYRQSFFQNNPLLDSKYEGDLYFEPYYAFVVVE